jgi:hypothetical protein
MHLINRFLNRSLKPTSPIFVQIAGVGHGAQLVRKNHYVVAANHEKVTDLLPVTARLTLVSKDVWVTP